MLEEGLCMAQWHQQVKRSVLANVIEQLDGVVLDIAHNRDLQMDQYCTLTLWMFSPILTSLRALQQASELDNARAKGAILL